MCVDPLTACSPTSLNYQKDYPLGPSTQTFCRKSPPTNGLSTYGFYFPSKCTCLLPKKPYLFIYIEENYNRQKRKGFGLLRQT